MKISFNHIRTTLRGIFYIYKLAPVESFVTNLLFIIATAVETYSITVAGQFIDYTVEILSTWETFTFKDYFYSDSFLYLVIFLITWIVLTQITNFRLYIDEVILRKYYRHVKTLLIDTISKQNMQEIESKDFQDLLLLVPWYSFDSLIFAYRAFSEMFRFLFRAVSSTVIIISTMGISGLLIFVFALPQAVVEFIYKRKLAKFKNDSIEDLKLINYLTNFTLDIPNFVEMKVDGIFNRIKNSYYDNSAKFDSTMVQQFFHLTTDKGVLSAIGQILTRAYAILIIAVSVAQKISIGQFKALFDYSNTAYDSFVGFATQGFLIMEQGYYIDNFFKFIDYKGFGDVRNGEKRLNRTTPTLELDNLDFQYRGAQHKSLENVSLSIEPGEKVLIIGGEGSGKSTLIKVLSGLYEITAGEYYIDGLSVRELKRGELKNKISLVTQDFNKYYFTLRKNITIASMNKTFNDSLFEKVCKVCQIDKIQKEKNISDNQILGRLFDKGIDIPLGYWQRIAIARALYRNKQIVILDEPFSYIDPESREIILKFILEFIGNDKTLVMISQDKESLDLFDKTYELKNGKLTGIINNGDIRR